MPASVVLRSWLSSRWGKCMETGGLDLTRVRRETVFHERPSATTQNSTSTVAAMMSHVPRHTNSALRGCRRSKREAACIGCVFVENRSRDIIDEMRKKARVLLDPIREDSLVLYSIFSQIWRVGTPRRTTHKQLRQGVHRSTTCRTSWRS